MFGGDQFMQGYATRRGIIWNTIARAQSVQYGHSDIIGTGDSIMHYALRVLVRLWRQGGLSRMYSAESGGPLSLPRLSIHVPLELRTVCSASHLAIKRSFIDYKGRDQVCAVYEHLLLPYRLSFLRQRARLLASSYAQIVLHPVEPVNFSLFRHRNRFG